MRVGKGSMFQMVEKTKHKSQIDLCEISFCPVRVIPNFGNKTGLPASKEDLTSSSKGYRASFMIPHFVQSILLGEVFYDVKKLELSFLLIVLERNSWRMRIQYIEVAKEFRCVVIYCERNTFFVVQNPISGGMNS